MFWHNLNRHIEGRYEYPKRPIEVPHSQIWENHIKVYFFLMAFSPKFFQAFQFSPSIFPRMKPKLKTKAFFPLQISIFKISNQAENANSEHLLGINTKA
jgi:hypothetical protein